MKSAFAVECLHAVFFQLATRKESLLPGCLPKWVLEVQPNQPEQPKETVEERDKKNHCLQIKTRKHMGEGGCKTVTRSR